MAKEKSAAAKRDCGCTRLITSWESFSPEARQQWEEGWRTGIQSTSGQRWELPSGSTWKKQNESLEDLAVPASRTLHRAAPTASKRCQSSPSFETRSCLSSSLPRRTGRAWGQQGFLNLLLSDSACTQQSQVPGLLTALWPDFLT